MVLAYRNYFRKDQTESDLSMPTIAQILLATVALGRRQFMFTTESQKVLNKYIENLTKQADEAKIPLLTSFLAKQPTQ